MEKCNASCEVMTTKVCYGMLGHANMCQIVRRHAKQAKMCQVLRHAKMYKGVTMHARDYQGNKREEQVKLQGNERIRGLLSHQFTFFMRGMLGTPTLAAKCKVSLMHSKCQIFLQNCISKV